MIRANRTTQLLLPFYSSFGNEFINNFTNIIGSKAENVRLYIGDSKYSSSHKDKNAFINEPIIFVQLLEEPFNFEKYLLYIQSHQNYITDYEQDDYKIIVFKLDEPYLTALKNLKQSKYSKMYDSFILDKFFSGTKDWYLMYVDDYKSVIFNTTVNGKEITETQMRDKWESINAENFYKNLILSPYHVFKKTKNLKTLLEIIYNTEIPDENELVSAIKLEQEILNYEIEN